MKGILKGVLRLLLWTLFAALVIGGLYLLCVLLDLPKDVVAACSALALALLLGIVLVRRAVVRRRRRLQMQTIVTLDSAGITQDSPDERLIDNRWNRAVSIMRASYLGRWGNPLYALPWYMVMGRTGAGKSSSIGHSGLNAMQTDIGPEDDGAGTRNCDWHFFREAVVMDTAGRYAVPLDEAKDSAEWREFLSRLARYRRKEPLNGLVIAVAADTLYGQGEHLLSEARCLRRRIDEIMRILGAKFPVYLMVTKVDLPAGMARVLESLPEERKRQSMGIVIQTPEKKDLVPVDVQIANALREVEEGLRSFCLYSGSPGMDAAPSPHRILAWEELRAMAPALRAYAEEVFAANPYQETPLLRGIFFSSALRGQQENSRAFPALAALARRVFRIRENAGGVFLHDFFGRILPGDRGLHRPVAEYLRWRSRMRIAAYGVLLLATFGLGALMCLAYQHNARLLERMAHSQDAPAHASMTRRLLDFEQRFREQTQLEKELGGDLLPSMGFDHAKTVFHTYANALNASFFKNVLDPALTALDEKRSRLTAQTDDKEFFTLISDVVWRYDLLAAVDKGKSFDELLQIPAMPQGILQALGLADAVQLTPVVAYSVARSLYSLRDPAEREQFLRLLRAALAQLPEIKNHSLQWLVYRAGALATLAPLHGNSFWAGAQSGLAHDLILDPVYTREGFAATLDYLDNLNLILADDAMKPSTAEFLRWYVARYQEAWQQYAQDFVRESAALAPLPARDETLLLMSSERNPFFAFLLRMDDELQAIRRYSDPAPAWMDDLAVFAQSLRLVAGANLEKDRAPIVQQMRNKAQAVYNDLSGEIDTVAHRRDLKVQALEKDIQEIGRAHV
jgi:type VI secretion system protein ImpL